jgi:DNA-binding FrmR family transcriptional regulator
MGNCDLTLKKDITTRLRRIEGQVKGIERMVDSGSECKEILIQISAVRAAINKVGAIVVENSVKNCLISKDSEQSEEESKRIDEMVASLLMFLK